MTIIIIYGAFILKLLTFPFTLILLNFFYFPAHANTDATTKVEAVFVNGSKAHQSLTLTGTVEAKQNANLAPLQSGVVAQLYVEVGDNVVKGQKLMQLDVKLAQLQLVQKEALLTATIAKTKEAERLYQEVILLSKKQLVAETLLSERQSDVEIAVAELARVKAEIAQQQEIVTRHTLYAPFAGVIAYRHIDVGEWVSQTTHAFTLVEQNGLRVNIAIPQEYLVQLRGKLDIDVTITPDFINTKVINAKLNRVVNVVNDVNRTISAFAELPENAALVAGMSVRVEIKLPESEQSFIWLPKSAIKQHPDGGTSVFKVKNNKAQRVLVTVLKQKMNQVAISGAPAEQLYVLTGIELIKDGDVLSVTRVDGENQ